MSWAGPQGWLTSLMGPSPFVIAITALLVLSVPLFLHLVIYRSISATTLPSFLLIGPSGSGKTSLLTLVSPILRPVRYPSCNHMIICSSNAAIMQIHTRPKHQSPSRCLCLSLQQQRHQNTDRSTTHHYKFTSGSCCVIHLVMESCDTTLWTASSSLRT